MSRRATCYSTTQLTYAERREPTSGLEPLTCSLRVSHQALLAFAQGCRFPIPKSIFLPRLALRCAVLRPRWYHGGIRSWLITLAGWCAPDRQVGMETAHPQPVEFTLDDTM